MAISLKTGVAGPVSAVGMEIGESVFVLDVQSGVPVLSSEAPGSGGPLDALQDRVKALEQQVTDLDARVTALESAKA
jgi:hypothetical protein